jgi:hypothetical protein
MRAAFPDFFHAVQIAFHIFLHASVARLISLSFIAMALRILILTPHLFHQHTASLVYFFFPVSYAWCAQGKEKAPQTTCCQRVILHYLYHLVSYGVDKELNSLTCIAKKASIQHATFSSSNVRFK